MFDQMQSHGHVGIEVAAWIVPIRPDSTHFCGQVDDHIGLCRGVQPLNRDSVVKSNSAAFAALMTSAAPRWATRRNHGP